LIRFLKSFADCDGWRAYWLWIFFGPSTLFNVDKKAQFLLAALVGPSVERPVMKPSHFASILCLGGMWVGCGGDVRADSLQPRAFIKSSAPAAEGLFGAAISAVGESTLVGAPSEGLGGKAHVFNRSGQAWSWQNEFESPSPVANGMFGVAVGLGRQAAIVGAPGEGVGGKAHVFARDALGVWSHAATLEPPSPAAGDLFGHSVAIKGDIAVVGACGRGDASMEGSGTVYVFQRDGSGWPLSATLHASDAGVGDAFGWSVAISGDTIAVGACFEDGVSGEEASNAAVAAGAVYVFIRSGADWTQQARLKAANADSADGFGYAVAIEGDELLVGAPFESGDGSSAANNAAASSGAGYVFTRTAGVWTQQSYLKAAGAEADDRYASSVAMAGSLLALGALGDGSDAVGVNGAINNAAIESGAVRTFEKVNDEWTSGEFVKASNTGTGDSFGHALAIVADSLVVGAPFEDSNATLISAPIPAQQDESVSNAGAMYALGGTTLSPLQSWRLAYFDSSANVGAGSNTADSDGDGIPNLHEFAFGTDPTSTQAGSTSLQYANAVLLRRGTPISSYTTSSGNSVDFRAVFSRRKDFASVGLTYAVQFSGDLVTWATSVSGPTVVASDANFEGVSVPYPFFVNRKKARFFRVVVSESP
jgi:hypothetical protein